MYIHMGWEGQKQFLQVLLFTYIIIIINIYISQETPMGQFTLDPKPYFMRKHTFTQSE